ncbi:unnamed protein product [Alternaria alternata]
MGFGILEDRHMAAPPGTSTINESGPSLDSKIDSSELKRDGDIILQPQPSSSPNDPLNWSPRRKECIMILLAFSSGVTTSLGPMVTPALPLIAMKYKVNIDMVASLVIGFLAFWIGQTIAGAIIQNISFEATFGISALIFIPILFGMYFFVVETTYYGPRPTMDKLGVDEKHKSVFELEDDREPYRSQLAIFRGRLSQESFWKNAWKPVPLIAFPAVLFSTIVYGSYFTWLLTISVLSVNIFSAPPYSLNPAQVGLTNLPLLVVALIGSPLSGWTADALAKFMARRNHGVFEPEFRLTLMIPATIFATIGFLGFGMSVSAGYPIVWPLVFMSIHSLSVPFASTASLTYVIDCHPKDANQAFVTINFTKAVFTFIATTYANGIMANIGPRAVFDGITVINLGICALTIPAYIFGKRFRSLVARSSFGKKLSG